MYNAAPELRRMIHSVKDMELEKHCFSSIFFPSATQLPYSNKTDLCYGFV